MDALRWSLCILLFLTVSRLHQLNSVLGKLRPLLTLTALIALYVFLNPGKVAAGSVFRTMPMRMVLYIIGFASVAAPAGISLGNSGLWIVQDFIKTITLCIIVVSAARTTHEWRVITSAYVAGCLALSWTALFFFKLEHVERSNFDYERLDNLAMWDANDAGLVLLVGVPLAILHLRASRGWPRWISMAAIPLIAGAVARTGSRGALIGMLCTAAALLLVLRGVGLINKVAFVGVAFAAISFFAPLGYWRQMQTLLEPEKDYNFFDVDGRKALAQRGIQYMLAYPIAGLGINNFAKAECTLPIKQAVTPAGKGIACRPPHNTFIQAGAELGIPGLVLFVMLTIGTTVMLIRLGRRLPASWARASDDRLLLYHATDCLAASIVAFCACSLFVTFAWTDIVYVFGAFSGSLIVLVQKVRDTDEGRVALAQTTSLEGHRPLEWRMAASASLHLGARRSS